MRAAACLGLACLAAVIWPAGASAACPNEAIRTEQGSEVLALPDCMALELVSPPKKDGKIAREAAISADGERVRYTSIAALADTTGSLAVAGDAYVATRTASGWESAPTRPPAGMINGWGDGVEALGFSPDFSRWFEVVGTPQNAQLGIAQAFQMGLGGLFEPLSPLLAPVGPGSFETVTGTRLLGPSADHSSLYIQPGGLIATDIATAYLPGDPVPAGSGAERNAYVAHLGPSGEPSVELVARDRTGKIWGANCGTRLGNGLRNQGALSPDGTRAYFSARPSQPAGINCAIGSNKLRILERIETDIGPWIGPLFNSECDRLSPEPACSTKDNDDLYEGASLDGTKVYFTSPRQLADSDLDGTGIAACTSSFLGGCDLYLYDSALPAGQRLIQVSAGEDVGGHETGKEAKVLSGVTAISGDGSHVYFVAEGILTGDVNPAGNVAQSAKPNLYLYERGSEELSFVGTLVVSDKAAGVTDQGLWGGTGTYRNRAYPVPAIGPSGKADGDGHILAFQSNAELTTADTDGTFLDVYRYDSVAETLVCVSCRPGGPDPESFAVTPRSDARPPGTDYAESGRWVSEDGNSIVLKTSEGLLGEANGTPRFYLWRSGQLYRLPGTPYVTTSPQRDGPFLSHDGLEVSLQTFSALVPQDGDTTGDVYVARAGGGFAVPEPKKECVIEEDFSTNQCQGSAAVPPSAIITPSEVLSGPRNVKPKPSSCPKGKRKVRRKGKVRCIKPRGQQRKKHSRKRASRKQGGRR